MSACAAVRPPSLRSARQPRVAAAARAAARLPTLRLVRQPRVAARAAACTSTPRLSRVPINECRALVRFVTGCAPLATLFEQTWGMQDEARRELDGS